MPRQSGGPKSTNRDEIGGQGQGTATSAGAIVANRDKGVFRVGDRPHGLAARFSGDAFWHEGPNPHGVAVV